jgi:hypothetical protein
MANYTNDTTWILSDITFIHNILLNTTYNKSNHNINDCLLWKGKTNSTGYPEVVISKVVYKVHRLVYQAYNPDDNINDMPIHHKCGNRLCVNRYHLQKVTHAQNVAEMNARLWYEKEIKRLSDIVSRCSKCNSINNRQTNRITDNIKERKIKP